MTGRPLDDRDDDSLDRLVNELDAALPRRPADATRLDSWLDALRGAGGSDLYLVAGVAPAMRVNGVLRRLDDGALDGDDIEEAVLPLLPSHAAAMYRAQGHADASIRRAGGIRHRVNLHRERGRAAASIRVLPIRPPQLGELGLPPTTTGTSLYASRTRCEYTMTQRSGRAPPAPPGVYASSLRMRRSDV